MDRALYDEMFRLEGRHWYFAGKRRIVIALLERMLPAGSARTVCDIGCGCGMMLRELTCLGFDAVGMDPSPDALEYCRLRGVRAVRGALPGGVDLPPGSMGAVLLLDVLEHIEEDRRAFADALRLVRPGGLAICTVPAYPWLWTRRDEFYHHRRRYDRRRLAEVVGSVPEGRVELLSYMNTLLFPVALVTRLARKFLPGSRGPGDLSVPPLGLNRLLESIFAAEGALLTRGQVLPFGLSLVAVVRKTGRENGAGPVNQIRISKSEAVNKPQIPNPKPQTPDPKQDRRAGAVGICDLGFGVWDLFRISSFVLRICPRRFGRAPVLPTVLREPISAC